MSENKVLFLALNFPDDFFCFYEQIRVALKHFRNTGWRCILLTNYDESKPLDYMLWQNFLALRFWKDLSESFFSPDFTGVDCWRVTGSCESTDRFRISDSAAYCGEKAIAHHLRHYQNGEVFDALKGTFRKPHPGMVKAALHLSVYPNLKSYPKTHLRGIRALVIGGPEDEQMADLMDIPFVDVELWRHEFMRIEREFGHESTGIQ